jgi:hypothetical protein
MLVSAKPAVDFARGVRVGESHSIFAPPASLYSRISNSIRSSGSKNDVPGSPARSARSRAVEFFARR